MKKKPTVIIAGAGGIAEALALILAEWAPNPLKIRMGNRTLAKAEKVVKWVEDGTTLKTDIKAFHLPEEAPYSTEMNEILAEGNILLDCLPGSQAPRMARLALAHQMHYVNLTEYVRETEEIMSLARDADQAFVLQTGLAPGFINVLAHGLFQAFCHRHGVEKVDQVLHMESGGGGHRIPQTGHCGPQSQKN